MAHDDHYHVHSHPKLPKPPAAVASESTPISIPQNTLAGPNITQSFYSLERDLEKLRIDAKTKKIISANDKADVGTTVGANPKKILALVIGGNLWPGPAPIPKVLIVGCHHAREW